MANHLILTWLNKPLVFAVSLTPFLYLCGWVVWGDLGSDPAQVVVEYLAICALNFLLVTLAVTPVKKLLGVAELIRFRRMIGLYVYFYAVLHVVSYLVLLADWDDLLADVYKRPYISVGFVAFVLLTALAITSNHWSMRKLRGRWVVLHRFIYLIAVLVIVHFFWQIRGDYLEPLIYSAVVGVLLGYRLWLLGVKRQKRLLRP